MDDERLDTTGMDIMRLRTLAHMLDIIVKAWDETPLKHHNPVLQAAIETAQELLEKGKQ